MQREISNNLPKQMAEQVLGGIEIMDDSYKGCEVVGSHDHSCLERIHHI